jgi:hypothetical protein
MRILCSIALRSRGTKRKRELIRSIMMGLPFIRQPRLFLILVDASRNDEARDAVIGLDARWNLLYVVHIEQDADSIRIISARKATREERADYET